MASQEELFFERRRLKRLLLEQMASPGLFVTQAVGRAFMPLLFVWLVAALVHVDRDRVLYGSELRRAAKAVTDTIGEALVGIERWEQLKRVPAITDDGTDASIVGHRPIDTEDTRHP